MPRSFRICAVLGLNEKRVYLSTTMGTTTTAMSTTTHTTIRMILDLLRF